LFPRRSLDLCGCVCDSFFGPCLQFGVRSFRVLAITSAVSRRALFNLLLNCFVMRTDCDADRAAEAQYIRLDVRRRIHQTHLSAPSEKQQPEAQN